MKKILFALALYSLSLAAHANSWHITTHYFTKHNPSSSRTEEVYLFKGFMKMEMGELSTIFDLNKGQIIYINRSNKTFWQGTPQEFNLELRSDLEAMIEQKLFGLEKEQQDAMRIMYDEMINASFPKAEDVVDTPRSFSVRLEKEDEKISGYNATKYKVFEEGLPLEDIWISPELMIAKDFDFISLSHFLNILARGAYSASFESSQEYFKLLEKGYPVKVEMPRSDGTTQVSEVVIAKRVVLNISHFSVPKGYTKGTLTSVGVWDGYM